MHINSHNEAVLTEADYEDAELFDPIPDEVEDEETERLPDETMSDVVDGGRQ